MELTEGTEIRKLTPKFSLELSRLLHDNWKTFMSNIPKNLEKGKYECKIESTNTPKYNSGHIRIIEQASVTTNRLPSDILLEEWSSSGRIRPTLGHLLFLLKECGMYGAADYVAKILGKNPPQRPSHGPGARIELTPTERRQIENTNSDIRSVLEQMNYPTSNIEQINYNFESEVNNVTQNIPQIIIDRHDSVRSNEQKMIDSVFHISNGALTDNRPIYNSDLIKFSNTSPNIPNISSLLNVSNENVHLSQNYSVEPVVPPLSALLNDSSNSVVQQESNLPNISMLNQSISSSNTSLHSSFNIPDFDALRSNRSMSGQNISIPRTLGSPLPSLSLNTLLKHYSYAEIEVATNYFNDTPYINASFQGLNPSCGRFLGSGAFGSVFLGFGLLDRPIAVKRFNLHDLNIVRADDIVTKQFTTEVENLYKYKHDNLLSLIGYSCDGLTYCLLYEYIPGGNLKDRLQATTNILNWMERLDIGLGTADAVAYLHTAYSAPLIHRDIKSANILLDDRNQAKLCDFGIIRISSSSTTGTSQVLGTSAYMPPEAHRGDVSVKLDTYSFGVVLLELLTGLAPVDHEREGNDIVTYVQDNLTDETDITPLLDMKAGVWESEDINYATELYKITMKCLQDKKNVRPTMVHVRDILRTLLSNRMQ